MSSPTVRYQDYVFRDGKLIGDFEGLYRACPDPWSQSRPDNKSDTRRQTAVNWIHRLRAEEGVGRVVELGCGLGHITGRLCSDGFAALGIDISQTAIDRAREMNPNGMFLQGSLSEFDLLERFSPDVFLMADITWFVLDVLDEFLARIKKYAAERNRPTYLIHLIAFYAPGVQKYGVDKFTNLDELLAYFKLNVIECGFVKRPTPEDPNSQGTYFVARL